MKKIILALLAFSLTISAVSACENCAANISTGRKGLLTDMKFFPLQIGLGIDGYRDLVDSTTNTILSLGVWNFEQKSSVISLSTVNEVKNNYGIQIAPLAVLTKDTNYGISLALLENCVKKNYGLQAGLFNVKGKVEMANAFGLQIAEVLQIGLLNTNAPVQIGLLNYCSDYKNTYFQSGIFNSGNSRFQIGLLNHSPNAWIPWFPILNFSFEIKDKDNERHTFFYRISNY